MESETPETDKAAYEATTRTVGKWIVPLIKARKLERERNLALDALEKIELHYVDGEDAYEAWKSMGEIAATFLSENVKELATPPTGSAKTEIKS